MISSFNESALHFATPKHKPCIAEDTENIMNARMKPFTHNGYVLDYVGDRFAPSQSNRITKAYFMQRGALANERNYKVRMSNGEYAYYDISKP